ncbi:MAG: LapA family protein [Spirochaetales bacterium]|nr:LapA family protein [Spirochaetales bacterium]
MFRIILSIVLLVVLVVLIVLNLGYTTPFNLFGWKFEELPVTAIALVAFAVGVLYSFAYYVGRYFSKVSKSKFRKRGEKVKAREQELNAKEKKLEEKVENIEETREQLQTTAAEAGEDSVNDQASKGKRGRKKRGK